MACGILLVTGCRKKEKPECYCEIGIFLVIYLFTWS